MKITGRKDYLEKLESVVMTDIILNMFIFFFISFSLLYTFNPYRLKKLEVKLPKAQSALTLAEKEQLNIIINNEGLIYLEEEPVTKKALKERISFYRKQNPSLKIIVSCDRLVRFRDIVETLDILNSLGITNLNLATAEK